MLGLNKTVRVENLQDQFFVFKNLIKKYLGFASSPTRIKKGKFYANVDLRQDDIPRVAIVSQLRLIDGKRLIDKIGVIDESNYKDPPKSSYKSPYNCFLIWQSRVVFGPKALLNFQRQEETVVKSSIYSLKLLLLLDTVKT